MAKGRVVIAIAALLAVLSGPVAAMAPERGPDTPYHWRNVTVGGGGFAPGIVFSTVERGLAYLRTDMGGAYRWDAAVARWVPLQEGNAESSYMGVESIAPDPVDANIVYLAAGMAAGAPAAIWRSANRGRSWTITPVPFAMGGNEDGRGLGERLAIDPHAHATLLFGSRHDGLWRSGDSGAHWAKLSGFPLAGLGRPTERRVTHGGLSFVLFDRAVPGRVFVGNADPGADHLFRSDDGGISWRAVAGGPAADLLPVKAAVGGDGVLTISYADGIGPNGITRGAVWRHDPADGSWRDVTPPGSSALIGGFMGVAVSAQDPRVIAVSTVDRYKPVDTVWRSADAGRTWRELWRTSTRDVSATPFLKLDHRADFGHWIAGLAIDPFDADHAAYVTGATLYSTAQFGTAGTMRWAPWTRGIEQTAIITLTSPTGGAPLVSGFGDIGGFRHDDLGRSPPHVHSNPYLTNTNTLDYAGLAPAIMVRTGNTHAAQVPVTSLAWSSDGGRSWRPVPMPSAAPAPGAPPPPEWTGSAPLIVSADGRTFLLGAAQPVYTRDRGAHWLAVTGLPPGSVTIADKADPRRFYAIDPATGRVLASSDGGASFAAVAGQGLPADLSSARQHNRETPSALLATPGAAGRLWLLLAGTLYRSIDGGARWERTGGDVTVQRYGLGKAAPGGDWPALYAIGTRGGRGGVFRSTDGGASWLRINDDDHQWGLRLRVISGDPRRFGRVYLGTDGRGILYGDPWERDR